MRRVMIIGQSGSGKSTLARQMGAITHLPVVHIDHIHWQTGWIERPDAERNALCEAVHAKESWIFEGGQSATWPQRLARADTLIWLDFPFALRLWRVLLRTVRNWGRNRPDLPDGCPDRFSLSFLRLVWRTRNTHRVKMQALYDSAPDEKSRYRLASRRDVHRFLDGLRTAATTGNLGISHR